MSTIRIAAAQTACRPGDMARNLARHRDLLGEARTGGIDLLVFPELSLMGYASAPDPDIAIAADDPRLLGLAGDCPDMVAVVGFMERNAGGRPFNTCAVLAGGQVAHLHRKLNLPTYGALVEGRQYTAGATLDTAETRLGRLATLVCADTWNPALPWLAALRGMEVMAVPVASARGAVAPEFDSREGWRINLQHTAMSYGVPIVMANFCGGANGLDFWGGSTIYGPDGGELARARAGEELLVAEIGLDAGRHARHLLPTVRDADPDLVARELARLLASRGPTRRAA